MTFISAKGDGRVSKYAYASALNASVVGRWSRTVPCSLISRAMDTWSSFAMYSDNRHMCMRSTSLTRLVCPQSSKTSFPSLATMKFPGCGSVWK